MIRKTFKIIVISIVIIVLSVFIFSDKKVVTDLESMIKDNTSAVVAPEKEIKLFLNNFVAAVKTHDKEKFLSCFSENATIEDPMGVEPLRCGGENGKIPVAKFYEANIAQNDVSFISKQDIICGMDVIRDALSQASPVPGITLKINTYSFYQLTMENGKIKIYHLRAFWEMDKMAKQFEELGPESFKVGMTMFQNMYKSLGIGGMIGYMKAGAGGIRDEGKKAVSSFAEAVNNNNIDKLSGLFKDNNSIIKFVGNGRQYNPQNYMSGPGKNTKINFTDIRAAGFFTASRFKMSEGNEAKQGIATFQFNKKTKKIYAARFYCN
ncbi:MAG: hypothetical protein HN737_10145 [Desulfobacterales bacterium]|jgi:hypothetical protein|nr:hypothetical protein [Desulfobacteraceae bacterium]MBT4363300.1 hypothetical protein [Desulfobacteraceae bacterium]MBT7085114.1 hypothetical protein [Desulfobacterales bacterium]MBT7697755.1 hypothetical protein [Desulfobacterales bacterium]